MEILFRGKRPNSGKWIEGYLYQEYDFSYILSKKFNAPECSCEVLTETIGQFTSFSDKKDKKLFNGDIINLKDPKYIYYIVYEEGAFYLYHTKLVNGLKYKWGLLSKIYEYGWGKDIEKIGNIHDNPEMLEQVNEN